VSETIHLACAVDGEFVPHAATMLLSALDHRGDSELRVHVLHPQGLPAATGAALAEMVGREGGEVDFLEVPDEAVAGFPRHDFAVATWYRVLLPELLPGVPRAIYLDADTIVLDDLLPLWATELGDHLLGAVTNLPQWDHVGRPQALGVPPGVEYFNAGVLLADLSRMREEDAIGRLRAFVADNAARLEWRDQDALNLVLGERRLALAPRWNVMSSILLYPWAADVFGAEAVREARERPAIRHFEGPAINKPWHYLCEHEMREAYTRLRLRTPWPRVRLEGRTPANIARRAVRRLRGRPAVPVPERSGVSP